MVLVIPNPAIFAGNSAASMPPQNVCLGTERVL